MLKIVIKETSYMFSSFNWWYDFFFYFRTMILHWHVLLLLHTVWFSLYSVHSLLWWVQHYINNKIEFHHHKMIIEWITKQWNIHDLFLFAQFLRPSAAGSGIPEVTGFLNGTMVRHIFNVKTLAVKFFSCVAAVGCGLPVGPEGPMIHMGYTIDTVPATLF